MKIVKFRKIDEVHSFELGYVPFGTPLMTSYFYFVDGLLIDTAPSNTRRSFIEIIQPQKIDQCILTHFHEDHSGNASVLRKLKKIPVYGHKITICKLKNNFKILPYQYFMWGRSQNVDVLPLPDKIETEHYCFTPIHTPGHSVDHMSYHEKNKGWLFSGDLYLASRIKYFRSDENIVDSISSLKMILLLDFDKLFCSHNPKVKNGKKEIKRKLGFLESFQGDVLSLFSKGYSEHDIVKELPNKESTLVKIFTFGRVSLLSMIRSVLKSNNRSH